MKIEGIEEPDRLVFKVSHERASIIEEWLKLRIKVKPWWLPLLCYKWMIRLLLVIETEKKR